MPDERTQPAARQVQPNSPKPTTEYIVVPPDWKPRACAEHAGLPHQTLKQAQADLDHADMLGAGMVLLKAETVYTLVKAGRHA